MTLSKSLITGHLNDATQIRFTLSAWDSELAEIVLSQSQTFDLVDGDLPDTCEIWQNQAGLRGTSYTVTAINRGGDGFPAREELGIIQVGTASSYVLADLLEASGSITPGNTYTVLTASQYATLLGSATIAQLITAAAAGEFTALADGSVVWAGGCAFAKQDGAAYAGLPLGFVTADQITAMHFGDIGDGSADDLSALTNLAAYVAATDDGVTTRGMPRVIDGGGLSYALSAPLTLLGSSAIYRNFTFLPTASYADTEPMVVVASGEANAVGNAGATGGTFKSNANVYAWLATVSGGAGAWVQNPNFATTQYYVPGSTTGLGNGVNNAALAFAHRLQLASNRVIRLVIEAKSGSPIADWIGAGTASVRYAALKSRVEEALATLGTKTKIDAFIFQQGESDSATAAATIETDRETLLTQLMAESWWNNAVLASEAPSPLATVKIFSHPVQANAGYDNLRLGINNLYWTNNNGTVMVAETAGLTDVGDSTHFDGASLFELGYRRYWEAYFRTIAGWAKPLVTLGSTAMSLDNSIIFANRKCAGLDLYGSRAKALNLYIEGALCYGVRLKGCGGESIVQSCKIIGLGSGNALFLDQDNWTSRGIWFGRADCKTAGNVINWNGVNIYHDKAAATTLINHTHTYNGGSGKLTLNNARNIIAMGGGLNWTGGYIDNGCVELNATNMAFADYIALNDPLDNTISALFLLRANVQAEPKGVAIGRPLTVSTAFKSLAVPVFKFEDRLSQSWYNANALAAMNSTATYSVEVTPSHTILFTETDNTDLTLISGSPTSGGTRINLVDADTTTAPFVRSAGNNLKLQSIDDVVVQSGSYSLTLMNTGVFQPTTGGLQSLGDSAHKFAEVWATTLRFGDNSRKIYGGTGSPVGVVSSGPGSIYVNQSAPTQATGLWLKITGTGSAGWYPVRTSVEPCTVSALPSAASVGIGVEGWVTNATVTWAAGIGTIVAGGGANAVPVKSDGTNWRIG